MVVDDTPVADREAQQSAPQSASLKPMVVDDTLVADREAQQSASQAQGPTPASRPQRTPGASSSLTSDLLYLYSLANADPLATCNDGTPAGYYFRPSAAGSDLWVVYLQARRETRARGWPHACA